MLLPVISRVIGAVKRSPDLVARPITETKGTELVRASEKLKITGASTDVLQRADELWQRGRKDFALKTVHAESIVAPKDDGLWLWLAEKYSDMNEDTAAAMCVRNAFNTNTGNAEALSRLIDVSKQREWKGEVSRAYRKYLKVVESDSRTHIDALTFFIPSKYEPGLRVLSKSEDVVVQAVLALASKKTIEDIPLSLDEQNKVHLIDNLVHGRQNKTIALIHDMTDDEVPVQAIRTTARRYLRAGKTRLANALLTELVRLDISDGWARQVLESLTKQQLSNYQLAKVGFPFTPKASKPALEVNRNRSLYLLHNSLPYHSAGYSTRTQGLLQSVRGLGWDVHGVTRLGYPFDMPKFEDIESIDKMDVIDGVPYHRLSTLAGIEKKAPIQSYVERYSRELEKLVREEKPFVLHAASNHWNGLTAVETANRMGIPSVYEVRGLWEVTRGSRDPEWAKGGMYRFMARMEADAAKNATRVLTITNALKEELVRRGVSADKITVLPNGVDSTRFVPRGRDEGLKNALGLSGKTVIGYVGSVLDYEGLGLLIDAAKILKKTHSDFGVMIVGDGAELEKFQAEVFDSGLEDIFVFTGRVPHEEVEKYYSIVDITPFPRLPLPVCEMVSPLKPFEAMAMQKAVVSSDVQALTEIVRHEENGLLHRKGSAESLAEQIERFLRDPELMKRMAENGREWVVAERQWKDLGKIVSDTYLQLGGSTEL